MKTIIFIIFMMVTTAVSAKCSIEGYDWVAYENIVDEYGEKTIDEILPPGNNTPEYYRDYLRRSIVCRDAGKPIYGEGYAARNQRMLDEQREMREEGQAAQLEKAQLEARDAELRGGSRPRDIREAIVFYNSTEGMHIVSNPKIRADNKVYSLVGRIDSAGSKPEFIARGDNSLTSLFRGRSIPGITYYTVRIPKLMRPFYYEHASVGSNIQVVGRYVGNTTYTTVLGQEKSMPVFEALYFTL